MGWIATTNNPAVSSTTYNPTANLDVNPANETEVTLTAKWKLKPKGIYTISNMQQMNPNICKANTTPNRTATQLDTDGSHHGDPNYVPTKTLTDTRDNNTYTVSKLADGKCWMTQNLRIIDKTITPADSDVTSNYTIPASSISGFDHYDTSNAYIDNNDGGFYTWYTATAGTGTQSISSGNTSVSICPKGWRLPTGGNSGEFQTLYNNYNYSFVLRSNPVNLTLSGYVYGSSRHYQGSDGHYWSSTVLSGYNVYDLYLGTSNVYPAGLGAKSNGFSVRCIADDKLGLSSIANMQDMTPEICAATITPNRTATTLDTDGSHYGDPNYVPTKTLTDTRDNNTYTVSKLADGKCWMTQNLRIIDKTITPADSDVTSNYTIPASSISGFDHYDTSNAYIDNNDGGFYTWYAATAGTGTRSMSSGNTTVSICPKGWRLPTGGNNGEFKTLDNNYNSLMSNPVNLTLSGYVGSSLRSTRGFYGYYWSSTVSVYSSDYAYNLSLNSSSVYPLNYTGKADGYSVRCLAR